MTHHDPHHDPHQEPHHDPHQEPRGPQHADLWAPPSRHTCKDVQTPRHWTPSRCYAALSNIVSPGDDVSQQDIIWDPTSPTQPPRNWNGSKNGTVVKISDIVNRLAPKEARSGESSSLLLQWIEDSGGSSTLEAPPPRARRRSIRQSSVDGLLELARQFDKNMERSNALDDAPHRDGSASSSDDRLGVPPTAAPDPPAAPQQPSKSQAEEVELQALFDGPTQAASGPLSQQSATPVCSQEAVGHPPLGLEHTTTPSTTTTPAPARLPEAGDVRVVAHGTLDEFEDDWENDDLLNDSLVLAMTQEVEPSVRLLPKTTTSGVNSSPSPPQEGGSLHKPRGVCCPHPKTAKRSTFKLESNPQYLPPSASTNHTPEPSHTVKPLKTHIPVAKQSVTASKPVTMKTVTTVKLQPSETLTSVVNRDSRVPVNPEQSPGDLDCSWDEGGDDQLLFQVCEDVERLSNSQPTPLPATPAVDGRRDASVPVPIGAASISRQLACGYGQSHSVPGASGVSLSYHAQVTVGADQSDLSKSHPGGHVGLGAFSGQYLRDTSRSFQDHQRAGGGFRPQTVTARPLQGNSKSHHATFKRHPSDSVAVGISEASAGGPGTSRKCSAAEIERKKQEALARKRQRMHDSHTTH